MKYYEEMNSLIKWLIYSPEQRAEIVSNESFWNGVINFLAIHDEVYNEEIDDDSQSTHLWWTINFFEEELYRLLAMPEVWSFTGLEAIEERLRIYSWRDETSIS